MSTSPFAHSFQTDPWAVEATVLMHERARRCSFRRTLGRLKPGRDSNGRLRGGFQTDPWAVEASVTDCEVLSPMTCFRRTLGRLKQHRPVGQSRRWRVFQTDPWAVEATDLLDVLPNLLVFQTDPWAVEARIARHTTGTRRRFRRTLGRLKLTPAKLREQVLDRFQTDPWAVEAQIPQ